MLRMLKTLVPVVLCAPPFVLILASCSFHYRAAEFDDGEGTRTDAIFCNIEVDRDCSSDEILAMAIDITNQVEGGFYSTRPPTRFGLDASAEALGACGNKPKLVTYKGTFPDGSAVCLNAATTFGNGTYATVTEACQAWCDSLDETDDDGNKYRCQNIAWPATGAVNDPVPNACTEAGTLRPDFLDLRRIRPKNVAWRNKTNVDPTTPETILRKSSPTDAFDAGAASIALLAGGDGYVEFTAPEATTERVVGLAFGSGDLGPSVFDVTFGVHLRNGTLLVSESGTAKTGALPYAPNATIRVSVVGGLVQYSLNGKVVHTSQTPVMYPMRAKAVLRTQGASIADARTTF